MESIGILPPFWLGFWIALGAVVLIAIVVLIDWLIQRNDGSGYFEPGFGSSAIGLLFSVVAVFALAAQFIAMVPYDGKYWETYKITTVIDQVDTALMSDGDSVSQNFVVELADFDRPVVTTDPRVLNLEGSEVTLLCGVEWVNWGYSADKWVCSLSDYKFTP